MNLDMDKSINLLFKDLSFCQNNLELTNLNIMEMLSSLTTIRNSITDFTYINNSLHDLGKKILLTYLIDGSNNVSRIVRNCPDLSVNINSSIDNDNFYLNLKDSLNQETVFRLTDSENNTNNYIIFLLDPSLSVVTFQSINLTELESSVNIQNLENFNLDNILKININYFEIISINTHYKLVLINNKSNNL